MTSIARLLTALSFAVLLSVGTARAQYARQAIKVKMPFDFTANQKDFPAGEYAFVRTAPNRLELRDLQGRVLTSFLTHSVNSIEKSQTTRLQFSTESGGHVLKQVWIEGDLIGNELPTRKQRTITARQNMRYEPGAAAR